MKAKAILTAILAMLLAACTLPGGAKKAVVATPAAPKPVAPAPIIPPPPSPSLSIPQTQVELPKEQPLDPAALPAEAAAVAPPPAAAPVASRNTPRRPGPPAATPPAEVPAPAPVVTPEPRETFQEIVPAAEVKRLQDRAGSRRREAYQILNQLSRRQMSNAQRNVIATIRSFLTLSEQAEKQNDMRGADSLAERAQILADELQRGK